MDAYQQTADLLKQLAHPARLRILDILAEEGEACVCHLEWRLGLRQASLSQHLARLREANLVTDQRQGLNIYYSLASGEISKLLTSLKRGSRSLSGKGPRHSLPPGNPTTSCPCPRCRVEE